MMPADKSASSATEAPRALWPDLFSAVPVVFVARPALELSSGGGGHSADPVATLLHLVADEATQGRQGGNGDHRDEREEQRILDEGRSSLARSEPATDTGPQLP